MMMPSGAIDKSISHILGGLMFSGLGLWHLFNHIRLFVSLPSTSSSSYVAPAWFPAPRVRHLELIVMLAGGVYGFATQMLAYSPMPFNADGSIPPERLPNHEHAIMYASLLVYAGSAIYLDRHRHRHRHTTLCMLLLAAVFAQELFVFHVHSTDHAGVEGRLHWFLQAAAATCLSTALLGAAGGGGGLPAEVQFAVSLVRSASLAFQGLWGVVIGVVWIPGMAPKGCFLDDGGVNLRCHGEDSLHHAVAVVNLQFGWCFVLVTVLVLGVYVYVCKMYTAGDGEVYGRLPEEEAGDEDDHHHDMKTRNCKLAVHDVHEFMSMEIDV
ncbi:hypothetical protein BDA96_05G230800 [Sorghum bicolor]|uniref:Uncharacterized protein n=2 Tax=Sorghum bicolor TaxID=4558 RepID=A0A921QZ04_SORBI|nr:uncharacterized protein LOC8082107 [Sorghum bicolor]KAG0530939.1 hypothetical protein BDA96_05G230800 [Sorghum bicolor]OQU84010.1 hypothetical protein SORBI_3005G215200 [Sorghum bicolor]|eukprot:XP_021316734.1 uncharacterized protein LOC8082107 [Sorghum bicolor]